MSKYMSMDNYASPAADFTARSVEEAAQLAGMESSEWAALEDGDIVVDPT